MALTIDQVKTIGIPKNISKLNNRYYTPAAVPNDSVNLYTAIKLVIEEIVGGSGDTNLGISSAASTTTITSSTGTSTTIPAATTSLSGVMSATDKVNQNALISLSGVSAGATGLGTFSGTTVTDDSTIKSAIQQLETAVEAIVGADGDGIYDGSGTIPNASVASLISSGTFAFGFSNAASAIVLNDTNGSTVAYDKTGTSFLQLTSSAGTIGVTGQKIAFTDGGSTVFTDSENEVGIQYAADYSSNYTNRTLVDKAYVDDAISAATATPTNAPAVSADANMGSGAVIAVSANSNDGAGEVVFTTGTAPTLGNGLWFTITFDTAYDTAPFAVFMPSNSNAGEHLSNTNAGMYVVTTTTTAQVYYTDAPDPETQYKYHYIIKQ